MVNTESVADVALRVLSTDWTPLILLATNLLAFFLAFRNKKAAVQIACSLESAKRENGGTVDFKDLKVIELLNRQQGVLAKKIVNGVQGKAKK